MEMMIFEPDEKSPRSPEKSFVTTQALSKAEEFLYDVDKYLTEAGIAVENIHSEEFLGQYELTLQPSSGIKAADSGFLFKLFFRELAAANNKVATFMSMPATDIKNGMHYNFSVQDTNGNVFYDGNQPDNLSDVCKHWMAGLLYHAPALAALSAPTVNCYRRCHTFVCPSACNWGIDDRTATIRVKNLGPSGTYIENRLGSGSANPYLLLTSTIIAGLDGVDKKMVCPPAVATDKEERKLPYDLGEALEELKVRSLGYAKYTFDESI